MMLWCQPREEYGMYYHNIIIFFPRSLEHYFCDWEYDDNVVL